MSKVSKRKKNWKSNIDSNKKYDLSDALKLVKEHAKVKFEEGVDLVFRLGVDPRKGDPLVRGTCSMPHGTGKVVRVLVFAIGEKITEAETAGADFVGGEDLVKKIQGGWMDFDRVVASPDMMAQVGKIGKLLGPRGLIPNPKVGTVTPNVGDAVKNIKQGQVQFRVDNGANVHVLVGNIKFEAHQLAENIQSVYETILKLKSASSKGTYIKNISVSSTMGPGIKVDINTL